MKRIICIAATFAVAILSGSAHANSSSIQLVLRVPVQCSLDQRSGAVQGDRIVMKVHRNCNSGHDVIVQGEAEASLGRVTIRYNGQTATLSGTDLIFRQEERYYDQVDELIVETTGHDADALERLRHTLQVGVTAG